MTINLFSQTNSISTTKKNRQELPSHTLINYLVKNPQKNPILPLLPPNLQKTLPLSMSRPTTQFPEPVSVPA